MKCLNEASFSLSGSQAGFPEEGLRSRDDVCCYVITGPSAHSEQKCCCRLFSLDFTEGHFQTQQTLFPQEKRRQNHGTTAVPIFSFGGGALRL